MHVSRETGPGDTALSGTTVSPSSPLTATGSNDRRYWRDAPHRIYGPRVRGSTGSVPRPGDYNLRFFFTHHLI